MTTPFVTVVVTVYQRTQFLEQALRSALDQTFREFEIIVTDDSNSAAIRSICESFQTPLIRYRTNLINLGVALNIRAAIEESRGRYISFLNDDDAWENEFLARLVAPLENDAQAVLSFSDHFVMSETGAIDQAKTAENSLQYGRSSLPGGKVEAIEALVLEKQGVPLAMAAVFRKEALALGLLVKEVSGAYDFWIACLLAASGQPVYYVPERLTRYRVHAVMETGRKAPDKNENLVYIYEKLIESKAFPRQDALLRLKHGLALYQVGRDRLLFGRAREARAYFSQSLRVAKNSKARISWLATYLPAVLRKALKFSA